MVLKYTAVLTRPAFARLEYDLPCVGSRDGKKVDRGKNDKGEIRTRARYAYWEVDGIGNSERGNLLNPAPIIG